MSRFASSLSALVRWNYLPHVFVGGLLGLFIYQGVTARDSAEAPRARKGLVAVAEARMARPAPPAVSVKATQRQADQLEQWARQDPVALLKHAMDHYQRHVQDYELTFLKEERINGKLTGEQRIGVAYMDEPFSVLMQWQANAGVIDKLLYVEGQNDDKMVVHPTGVFSFIKSVRRDPSGEQARQSSRGTCDRFGFYRTMESLLSVYEQARQAGDLTTRFVGTEEIDGRQCLVMERLLPPKDEYPCARLEMAFDTEYLVPIRLTSYDWQGGLLSRYVYQDIAFNTGLDAGAFTTEANGL